MLLQIVVISLTATFILPGSDAYCSDLNPLCQSWARRGECARNPGYMRIYCKKSCGLCPKQGRGCQGCWDYNTQCSSWASRGECQRNPAYMLKYCRFSCKVCTCSRPKPPTELPTPPPIPTTQRPVTRPTPPKPTTDWLSPPPPKPGTGIPPIPTKELPSPPMPTTEGPMSPEPGTTAPPVPPMPVTTAEPVPPMPETTAGPVPPMPETTAKPVPPMPETTAGPVPSTPGNTTGPVPPMPGTTSPPIPGGNEYDEVEYDNGDDEDDVDDNDDVCKNPMPVGIAESTFPGEAFKASTSESQWHQPEEGRLNNQESDESVGAWCAGLRDNKQYIKVDLGEMKKITAIYSQGRESEYPKFVTKYSVDYSKDGTSWESYKDENDPRKDKVFEGNSDNTSIKINKLKKFVLTKHLRIRPMEWKNMICMRLEFEYCSDI